MGEQDQHVPDTVVGPAEEKSCGHQLTTVPFAEVVRICVVTLKVWPQPPSATLDSGLGKPFR